MPSALLCVALGVTPLSMQKSHREADIMQMGAHPESLEQGLRVCIYSKSPVTLLGRRPHFENHSTLLNAQILLAQIYQCTYILVSAVCQPRC